MRRRSAFDDDVETGLEDLAQSRELRHMSEKERKRAKREAERIRGQYDIPRAVKEGVERIAEEQGISASAVAGAFLADALRRYGEGEISLYQLDKEPSISPLYDFKVTEKAILKVLRRGLS